MRIVQCRYEHNIRGGKEFTEWFDYDLSSRYADLNDKDLIKQLKEDVKFIDKATKLKHEFKIADEKKND